MWLAVHRRRAVCCAIGASGSAAASVKIKRQKQKKANRKFPSSPHSTVAMHICLLKDKKKKKKIGKMTPP
jgi:hypothetical protein